MLLIFKCFLCTLYPSTWRKLPLNTWEKKWSSSACYWELRLGEVRQLGWWGSESGCESGSLAPKHLINSFLYILVQKFIWTKHVARHGDALTFNKNFSRKPASVILLVSVPGLLCRSWGCSSPESGCGDRQGKVRTQVGSRNTCQSSISSCCKDHTAFLW